MGFRHSMFDEQPFTAFSIFGGSQNDSVIRAAGAVKHSLVVSHSRMIGRSFAGGYLQVCATDHQ